MLDYKSKPPYLSSSSNRQEKQTGADAATSGAKRLGKFGSTLKDKSKGEDMVTRIQTYGREEGERQKKKKEEDAAKKKTAETKSTSPQKGFVERMMDKYIYGKKEQ